MPVISHLVLGTSVLAYENEVKLDHPAKQWMSILGCVRYSPLSHVGSARSASRHFLGNANQFANTFFGDGFKNENFRFPQATC